ncbi:MAG: RelA/SpoT family protein [Patescibacteria group bacterium]
MSLFKELSHVIRTETSGLNLDRIKRAYDFAEMAHEGQFRKSGEAYIVHPTETAKILAGLHVDEDTIIAGLLHDVPEDTKYTVEDLEKNFGKHVSQLVYGLTKLSKVHYKYSMDDRQVHSLQRMFVETADDPRVIVIKLSDRLHNMKTLQYLRPEKQQRIAKETLEVFAPLANLFGIFELRHQLEDLCFFYLQPEEYSKIESYVHDHDMKRKNHISKTLKMLERHLGKSGLKVELKGRPKHFYSIYKKTVVEQKMLQDIYDYFAVRVLTENLNDCYLALAKIHEIFKPKPGRFKDYIALPKGNGYQSLHTTVIGPEGKLMEIQIRTKEMDERAEYGVAAHLLYKKNKNSYLEKSIDIIKNYKNPGQFIDGLQDDILQNRIYVFSPSGELVDLPEGATCLDYIYATELPVDTKVMKVMVNGKYYSLIGELKSGDYIEIIYTNKKSMGPERWWLEHVRTATAKDKIQDFFKRKSLETKLDLGEKLLQQTLDYENHGPVYQIAEWRTNKATKAFKVETFSNILSKIGEGTLNANEVYKEMFPDLQLGLWNEIKKFYGIFAKKFFRVNPDSQKYKIKIFIEAYDRKGLLKDLIDPFYKLGIPILKIVGTGYDVKQSFRSMSYAYEGTDEPGHQYVSRDYIEILVENHEQLISLFDMLESVPGVRKIKRIFRRNQIIFGIMLGLACLFWAAHPFIVNYIHLLNWSSGPFLQDLMTYFSLFSLFAIIYWLESMSNKTFPHFEETKFFWPIAFIVCSLAVLTLFVEGIVFDLGLRLNITMGASALAYGFLIYAYFSHEKRRKRHLTQLKEPFLKRYFGKTKV